jgi:hypothetical protein
VAPDPYVAYEFRSLPGDAYAPPFAPAEFVLRAVAESQALRAEQARALTGGRTFEDVAEIQSESLGAGLGLDRVLYVLPAVASVQTELRDVQERITTFRNSSAIGAQPLFNDLGRFAPFPADPDAAASGAASPGAERTPAPVLRIGDASLEAILRAAGKGADAAATGRDAPENGKVAAGAPSFSTQLKDAAANMRSVPLPGKPVPRAA